MDFIKIICNIHNNSENMHEMSIDFDRVMNLINSNFIVYIDHCNHVIKELEKLFVELKVSYLIERSGPILQTLCVINYNYLDIYNRFVVEKDKETTKLFFFFSRYLIKDREICVGEFLNTIKKGTIINPIGNGVIQNLEELLHKSESDFILKKIEKTGYITFMIDTLNYTKPAIK